VLIVFYNNYLKICDSLGVTPTRVLIKLGISKGNMSNWKNGSEPLNETKKKIADYLHISIEELESGEIKKPAIQKDDGQTETFMKLFKQVKEEDQLAIIAKMLDMLNQK